MCKTLVGWCLCESGCPASSFVTVYKEVARITPHAILPTGMPKFKYATNLNRKPS